MLPDKNAAYAEKAYWDSRYRQDGGNKSYDWLRSTEQLWPYLGPLLPDREARILMLGCGNSTLSEDMDAKGFSRITSLDYSEVCIEQMRQKRPDMQWTVGDIRGLPFEDSSFDVLIDKGTMDAMMTKVKDPWNPPPEVLEDCRKEVHEAIRVLVPGGVFIYITWAQPHFRKPLLKRDAWDVQVVEMASDGFAYYLFAARKHRVGA